MTYQQIKERLTKCELTLEKIKDGSYKGNDIAEKTAKLELIKESYQKLLAEAEKTAYINGNPVEYRDEDELDKFKDNQDVKSIKTASGKKLKEKHPDDIIKTGKYHTGIKPGSLEDSANQRYSKLTDHDKEVLMKIAKMELGKNNESEE